MVNELRISLRDHGYFHGCSENLRWAMNRHLIVRMISLNFRDFLAAQHFWCVGQLGRYTKNGSIIEAGALDTLTLGKIYWRIAAQHAGRTSSQHSRHRLSFSQLKAYGAYLLSRQVECKLVFRLFGTAWVPNPPIPCDT